MNKKVKKLATMMLVGAMAVGTTANAAAADSTIGPVNDSDTIYLSGGYADCYIECDNSYAIASTYTYSDQMVDSIYAYVDVSFEMLESNGGYYYVGDDYDESSPSYGKVAYASCGVSGDGSYSLAGSASSNHSASIEDSSGNCSLSISN